MNQLPKLIFDKNRLRIKQCPCGKNNGDGKFAPYLGHDIYGYCHTCGTSFLPELPIMEEWQKVTVPKLIPPPKIDFIPYEVYEKQFKNGAHLNAQNNFLRWLGNDQRGQFAFDVEVIKKLLETYFIGNSGKKKYAGWTLFPYIDINGRVRDIKAMAYNPDTGKRIKEPYKVLFIGKEVLKNPNANTDRCFYGEHLLAGNKKPIKIFESEATATYAAPFFPDSICLATGGSNGCKWTERSKCQVLKGRLITLYPDIDAHDVWEQKAEILRGYGINVKVSKLIKSNALKFSELNNIPYSELVKQKFDLRDILKYKNLKEFLYPKKVPTQHELILQKMTLKNPLLNLLIQTFQLTLKP
jgi:hypothetical protein